LSPVADCNLSQYYDIARASADKLSLLRSFFGCLANALQYIHSVKIRHRDVKPQNILVKGDRVLLTDFGIALDWQNLSRSTTTADSGKTWVYAAPEVARYDKRNSAADVWSLGCVFMEMITVLKGETIASMRSFLDEQTGNHRFYANIEKLGQWAKRIRTMGSDSDNVVLGWVRAMLEHDADERPTASELYDDIVSKCLKQQVPFCGSCCTDDGDTSSAADRSEDELWQQTADLTIVSASS
jgi:serine/threonine protein kinase